MKVIRKILLFFILLMILSACKDNPVFLIITYNVNGGTAIETVKIEKGSRITMPQEPTKDNFEFDGWYQDSDLLIPWLFEENVVDNDLTLYAKWCVFVAALQYTLQSNHTYAISGYNGTESIIYLPSRHQQLNVTNISSGAFEGNTIITEIYLPNSILKIGSSAFSECINLSKIDLGNSLIDINTGAFLGCSSLVSVDLPTSITNIGRSAFADCINLANIDLPNNIMSIGSFAFRACESLTSIQIPSSITNIAEGLFYYCTNLKSIILPDGLKSIERLAFYNCHSLPRITLPKSLASIDGYAFAGCSALSSIFLHSNISIIGEYAFMYCSSLTIYCAAKSKPSGWNGSWNTSERPVYWDYQN